MFFFIILQLSAVVIQVHRITVSDMETPSPTRARSCWSVILGTNLLVTLPGHVKQMANGQVVNQLARVSNDLLELF